MVYARHSTNYLCPLTQTIYHTLQNARIIHMTRADEVDICLALKHVILQHWSFPYQQLTIPQWDNIPMRISNLHKNHKLINFNKC